MDEDYDCETKSPEQAETTDRAFDTDEETPTNTTFTIPVSVGKHYLKNGKGTGRNGHHRLGSNSSSPDDDPSRSHPSHDDDDMNCTTTTPRPVTLTTRTENYRLDFRITLFYFL